jgi:hypothetical protein
MISEIRETLDKMRLKRSATLVNVAGVYSKLQVCLTYKVECAMHLTISISSENGANANSLKPKMEADDPPS